MNPLETAKALAVPVGYLGGSGMTDPATYASAPELGFRGRGFYFIGRGAAMGDVRAEVVASSMAFFPPQRGDGFLQRRPSPDGPGTRHLRLSRSAAVGLGSPADRVGTGSGPDRRSCWRTSSMVPMRAGARAVRRVAAAPRPADLPALRHSSAARASRVRAAASTALAVFASGHHTRWRRRWSERDRCPFGTAESMGWAEPLPECTDELLERRAAAEELDRRADGACFSVLSDSERAELVECVLAVKPRRKPDDGSGALALHWRR